MSYAYILCPLVAWLLAGSTKFLVNSARGKKLAFDAIGYGGFPSTHSAIVSATVVMIALREGVDHPAFAAALALALIVILDAGGLRRHLEQHAQQLNRMNSKGDNKPLRERLGHTRLEIAGGIAIGIVSAYAVHAARL